MTSPERLADRVLDALDIRDVSDLQLLEEIAWARHRAIVKDDSLSGSEARLAAIGDKAVITVSSVVGTPQRRRFCIAHEIGHLELRHLGGLLIACSTGDLNSWVSGKGQANLEELANRFAAAFLLPERFFATRCIGYNPSLDRVSQLAEHFGVSLTATAIRYVSCCQEPVAVIYSEHGCVRWVHRSPEFEELGLYVEIGGCLDSETMADRIFSGKSNRSSPTHVPARSWLVNEGISDDASLVEHSWPMPHYDGAITLLWADSDIPDDDEDDW